jgi:Glyoxalase-like domain
MPTLDHLVYATTDLAATVTRVEEELGMALSPGGQHVGLGTRNYLASFGDGSYLEIVGPDPDQPEPGQPRPFGIDSLDRPRLVTWAIRVDDMDETCAQTRAAGWDPGPAVAMQRATPDGGLLSWRLTAAMPGGEGLIPFLIDWGMTVHPSSTVTAQVSRRVWRAEHPDPERVTQTLSALDVAELLTVARGPESTLIAVVAGPGGELELR